MSIYDQIIAWRIETDLLNRITIMQDLCNCCAWYLKDIDPQTNLSPIMIGEPPAESTVADLKSRANDCYNSLVLYYQALKDYTDNCSQQMLADALTLRGFIPAEVKGVLTTMRDAILSARSAALTSTTKEQLSVIGDTLFASVPSLQLVRRPWMQV